MRVAVLAEWYPSRQDPVHGIWAHRQAVAVRDAGAEVRVVATRRPIPPLVVARRGPEATARWLKGARALLAPWELDGIRIDTAPFVSPPRPLSYGVWGWWMAGAVGRALDRVYDEWPFDVLHAHSVTPPGYAAARWIRGSQRPGPRPALAVSTHGPDIISGWQRSRWAAGETREVLDRADAVIANSRWAGERCEAIAGGPLPVEVVHLGGGPDWCNESGAARPPSGPGSSSPGLRAAEARRERPTIVTVAHLHARKCHAVVLHALAALPPERRPDYLVIGDGPGREPLGSLAARLGVADRVTFLGQLENREAIATAAGCDLFVMPSIEEPFGVAYVEAMSQGLPAIGTAGEGGPEDIAEAGAGLVLVPRDDPRALAAMLGRLLDDPEGLSELGRRARATAERHFTWAGCGERTLAAYERALALRR